MTETNYEITRKVDEAHDRENSYFFALAYLQKASLVNLITKSGFEFVLNFDNKTLLWVNSGLFSIHFN